MSIKNLKIRFNLDKENDRKAYEYLQGADRSYSKAVISAYFIFRGAGLRRRPLSIYAQKHRPSRQARTPLIPR